MDVNIKTRLDNKGAYSVVPQNGKTAVALRKYRILNERVIDVLNKHFDELSNDGYSTKNLLHYSLMHSYLNLIIINYIESRFISIREFERIIGERNNILEKIFLLEREYPVRIILKLAAFNFKAVADLYTLITEREKK